MSEIFFHRQAGVAAGFAILVFGIWYFKMLVNNKRGADQRLFPPSSVVRQSRPSLPPLPDCQLIAQGWPMHTSNTPSYILHPCIRHNKGRLEVHQ